MKTNLRTIFSSSLFCLVFGCAVAAFGQNQPVTGGYQPKSVSSKSVKAAANFAVEQKASESLQELNLEGIINAETQTAAGTNYKLCLQLSIPLKNDEEDILTLYIKTVINQNLNGEYIITSWEEEDCAEK